MKNIITFLLLSVSYVCPNYSSAQSQANNYEAKHQLVIQLTSSDTMVHKGLMEQLNNLTTGFGDEIKIEVVCHGPGIFMLHKNKSIVAAKIQKMKTRGVSFVACENTMTAKKINKEDLFEELDYVKMGIGEIIIKQEAGWSYVKAGF